MSDYSEKKKAVIRAKSKVVNIIKPPRLASERCVHVSLMDERQEYATTTNEHGGEHDQDEVEASRGSMK